MSPSPFQLNRFLKRCLHFSLTLNWSDRQTNTGLTLSRPSFLSNLAVYSEKPRSSQTVWHATLHFWPARRWKRKLSSFFKWKLSPCRKQFHYILSLTFKSTTNIRKVWSDKRAQIASLCVCHRWKVSLCILICFINFVAHDSWGWIICPVWNKCSLTVLLNE